MDKDLERPGAGWADDRKRLASKEELPSWQSPYYYVMSGYRLNYGVCDCAKSVFAVHNETLNIWTHLVGVFVWIQVSFRISQRAPVAALDRVSQRVHYALFAMCGVMPIASALAHTFSSCGPTLSKTLWKADFASINLLLLSRTLLEGWLLMCSAKMRLAWVFTACICFGCGTVLAVRRDSTSPIAVCALFMHLPLLFFFFVEWPWLSTESKTEIFPGLRLTLCGSFAGALGFVLRATSIPERWRCFPSSYVNGLSNKRQMQIFFDVIGSSHQWWHVLTIVGPVLCALGNERLLEFRMTSSSSFHCLY